MSFEPFPFTCPFCGNDQSVTQPNFHEKTTFVDLHKNEFGGFGHTVTSIACANSKCAKVSMSISLSRMHYNQYVGNYIKNQDQIDFFTQSILPQSKSKPQPEYIPLPLREDYLEACLIKDLSPKASATLARRCLQGMIRDFCGITKGTLYKEIEELQKMIEAGNVPKGVSEDSIEAIDAIRKIGNIGAHMEKDINHIIDVEPEEAQVLIELIETLFEEWYVAKHKREQRFAKVKGIVDQKLNKKVAKPST